MVDALSALSTEANGVSVVPEIQPWVVAGRIAAILGMGLCLSLAILFLLGAIWVWGVAMLVLTLPFVALMIGVERSKAARAMSGKPPGALEPEP
jgi:hypothetical protein